MRAAILCVPMILCLLMNTANGVTFDVVLDTNQAVPPPTLSGANPSGSASLDVNTITGEVNVSGSYNGMTSNVSAAHLHGLAPLDEATGVIFGFDVSGGSMGTFTGSDVLSPENLDGLLAGQTYLNVHTENNGPGEIRAQVVDSDIKVFNVTLSPEQEVPAPTLNNATPSGEATVVVDMVTGQVEVSGTYTGMTSNVSDAHLHGLAGPGTATGVIFGFDVSGGTSGTFSGADILSAENLGGLLARQTYLNVHTEMNGPGEIRAQVVPEPTSCALALLALVALLFTQRRYAC